MLMHMHPSCSLHLPLTNMSSEPAADWALACHGIPLVDLKRLLSRGHWPHRCRFHFHVEVCPRIHHTVI